VFNIADSCVVVGAVLVVVLTFKGINLDGTLDSDESNEAAEDTAAAARPERVEDRNDHTEERAETEAERREAGEDSGEVRDQ